MGIEGGEGRAAEIEPARDLEASSGALFVRWSITHGQAVPIRDVGRQHGTTPDLDIEITLDGLPVMRDGLPT